MPQLKRKGYVAVTLSESSEVVFPLAIKGEEEINLQSFICTPNYWDNFCDLNELRLCL